MDGRQLKFKLRQFKDAIQEANTPPFTYHPGSWNILDFDGNLVFDVRGWGHLESEFGIHKAMKIQDSLGHGLAEFLNQICQVPISRRRSDPRLDSYYALPNGLKLICLKHAKRRVSRNMKRGILQGKWADVSELLVQAVEDYSNVLSDIGM